MTRKLGPGRAAAAQIANATGRVSTSVQDPLEHQKFAAKVVHPLFLLTLVLIPLIAAFCFLSMRFLCFITLLPVSADREPCCEKTFSIVLPLGEWKEQ